MKSNQILKIMLEGLAHQCKPPVGLHCQLAECFLSQRSAMVCEEIGDGDSKDIL